MRLGAFLFKKKPRRIIGMGVFPPELKGRTARQYIIKEGKAKARLQRIFGKKNIEESKTRVLGRKYKLFFVERKDIPRTTFVYDPNARILIRLRLSENTLNAGIVKKGRINTSRTAIPILVGKIVGEEVSVMPTLEGFRTTPEQAVSRLLKTKKFKKKFFQS